ncbi:MAG TPA: hypothetical protein VE093_44045 [Polyangiaceae bacterium]|nr:hypothetical protein [Polyangiaceae bacterium]
MLPLKTVAPTGEQLKIINDYKPGTLVIRGAAGSGKTTTALLRLKFLVNFWESRRVREEFTEPTRILVMTFNRTLRGYIKALTKAQINKSIPVQLEIRTFGKWSKDALPYANINDDACRQFIRNQSAFLPSNIRANDFIVD